MVDPANVSTPQPLGMYAGELLQRSREYADAFGVLDVKEQQRFLYVGYFLLSHSVELALKSFLAARGVPKRELSSPALGHDQQALYDRAATLRLPTVAKLALLIEHLGMMSGGRDHALRYPAGFFESVPDANECLEVARSLIAAIEPAVDSAFIRARLHFGADPRFRDRPFVEWSD